MRDRNHASVLVWSVGNENTTRAGPWVRALRAAGKAPRQAARPDAARRARVPRLSDDRTTGALHGARCAGRERLLRLVSGPGELDREPGGPRRHTSTACIPTIRRQALFVTEFGAEANRSGPVGEKGTFEFQRDFLAYHLRSSRSGRSSTPRWSGYCVTFVSSRSTTAAIRPPTPPTTARASSTTRDTKKPAFDGGSSGLSEGSTRRGTMRLGWPQLGHSAQAF